MPKLSELRAQLPKLDAFTLGYIECALWTEQEELGGATIEDLATEALDTLTADG